MQHKIFDKLAVKSTRRKMLRTHIFGVLLLITLVVGIQLESSWQSRAQYQERTRLTAQNIGNLLAESIGGFFRNVDITLLAVVDQVGLQERGGMIDKRTFNYALAAMKNRVPGLTDLRVTDASGMVKFGTGMDVIAEFSVEKREYFQRLKANPSLRMIMSGPLMSITGKKWVVVCAHAFYRIDGQFGGIVYATIELDHLAENILGKQIDLGLEGIFGLGDDDQNLIVRYIHNKQDASGNGKKILSPVLQQLVGAKVESAYYSTRSKLDQVERIAYFRRVPGQPLNVVVALGTRDALSGWRHEAKVALITTLLFALLTATGSVMLFRERMRHLSTHDKLKMSNRQLAILSTTDGLTGLANRRLFDEVLETEWRRAARHRQPLALAMLDIDLFKKYNDHYGHLGGDDCLRQVVQVLKRHIGRAGDLLARYGGEEFVFIAPATGISSAMVLAEAIRTALEELALPHAQSSFGHVTVSIGLAVMIPAVGQTPDQLIQQADQALYRAKRQGRNRVVLAD